MIFPRADIADLRRKNTTDFVWYRICRIFIYYKMDFTLKIYTQLLKALQTEGYSFQSFNDFIKHPVKKVVVLRHDVDKLPENSLIFAQIQHKLGIKGSYFFRIVPQSFDEKIIEEIAGMGHEIGYHYEDLSLTAGSMKNEKLKIKNDDECSRILFERGIESFQRNLETFRKIAPVKTICMHGSPWSKYDNRLLWKYYDYRDFGIIGEPYLDIDFTEVLYLTDTGRRWDGERVSVRDKAIGGRRRAEGIDSFKDWVVKPKPGSLTNMTEKGIEFQSRYNFRSTNDIIRVAENSELPDKVMMTFHPQRWHDKPLPWIRELVMQNLKNVVKRTLISIRK
ncbi:hypothetical protein ES705_40920 [subsurface metagenome]